MREKGVGGLEPELLRCAEEELFCVNRFVELTFA